MSAPWSIADPARDLSSVLAADDHVVNVLLPALECCGMTVEQFRALRRLAEADDGVTVGDLGRAMATSPAATTRVVDRLATDGLVHRCADRVDRRRVLVRLSHSGERLWGKVIAQIETVLAADDATSFPAPR